MREQVQAERQRRPMHATSGQKMSYRALGLSLTDVQTTGRPLYAIAIMAGTVLQLCLAARVAFA